MERIGFIGLGIMGKPMAKQLLAAGCEMLAFDIDNAALADVVAAGATASTPSEIGRKCKYIFTILPNGDIVKNVLFAKDGVCEGLQSGSIVVDMSSVTPTESIYCAQELQKKQILFIDAPVSGGEPKAIDGTLAFMAGGERQAFEQILPYFDIMGSSAMLVGKNGSGSTTKLANQIIVNMTIAAVSEAFVLAAKAGVDLQKVYEAIRGGLAGSAVLDAKAPMMIARDFKPGGKISINHKDIKNVMNTAHDMDVPLPLTAQLYEVMQYLKVHGHMDDDHSGIVQYFEMLADVTVGKEG